MAVFQHNFTYRTREERSGGGFGLWATVCQSLSYNKFPRPPVGRDLLQGCYKVQLTPRSYQPLGSTGFSRMLSKTRQERCAGPVLLTRWSGGPPSSVPVPVYPPSHWSLLLSLPGESALSLIRSCPEHREGSGPNNSHLGPSSPPLQPRHHQHCDWWQPDSAVSRWALSASPPSPLFSSQLWGVSWAHCQEDESVQCNRCLKSPLHSAPSPITKNINCLGKHTCPVPHPHGSLLVTKLYTWGRQRKK